jgi:hypothetical protein
MSEDIEAHWRVSSDSLRAALHNQPPRLTSVAAFRLRGKDRQLHVSALATPTFAAFVCTLAFAGAEFGNG